MKRVLLVAVVLVIGAAAVAAYLTSTRDEEYSRLILDGEQALADDQSFLAIEAFSGAIALKKDSMLGYLKRGETYRRRGDPASALRDLREAVRLDPTATRPLEELGDAQYALEHYTQAKRHYERYTELDDQSARVLYKLALARYREGDSLGAVPALRQAVSQDDRFAEAHYLLGLCLRDQAPEESRQAWERATELSPVLVHAREGLAALHRRENRLDDEVEQLEALAALDSGTPDRQIDLALGYARAGRTDLAVLALGRTAEHHPEEPRVYVALGRIWLDAAEARNDRVALGKALEALQDPVSAGAAATSEALTLLGRALLLYGDTELAERVLQRATARFPIDPTGFVHLASAAEQLDHHVTARDALVSYDALVGDMDEAPARVARAITIADLSLAAADPESALQWLRRAEDARPLDPSVLARLADAEWQTGDVAAARATLGRALDAHPDDPILLALQARLVE